MKKLLFVLAFTFIGQQAFSQMYIVAVRSAGSSHPSNCPTLTGIAVMTTIDPLGNITYDCLPDGGHLINNGNTIALINQKFLQVNTL